MPPDALYDDRPGPPAKKSKLPMILGVVFGGLLLAVGGAVVLVNYVDTGREKVSSLNLKLIALALHNYHDTHGALPANTYAADGTPLLSWRVHLLPYMEADTLYRQFHLDEPWDSPHNYALLKYLPQYYATSTQRNGRSAVGPKTYYRAFATPGAVMAPAADRPGRDRPRREGEADGVMFADITDGLSKTVFVIEAGEAVEWTKPDDLAWDVGLPLPAFGADRGTRTFLAMFGDGSVTPVKKTITADQLKAAVSCAGGEPLTLP